MCFPLAEDRNIFLLPQADVRILLNFKVVETSMFIR